MTTSLKKLFLALLTALLGVMSSGAMAVVPTYNATVNGTNYDLTTYSGPDAFAIASNQAWWGNQSLAQDIATQLAAAPFGSANGIWGPFVAYSVSTTPGDLAVYTTQNGILTGLGEAGSTYVVQVGVGAAPEIDGSLAPKVGFLLGCLFLMFGRKKQDSEPMMTA